MARARWRKQHEWTGLGVFLFMLMFCLSGIVLNHRQWSGSVNVSRSLLPSRYHYHNWNNGLLRGTLSSGNDVIVYGSGGMFLCDKDGGNVRDLNVGLPPGADERAIRAAVKTTDGIFAISQYALYRLYDGRQWIQEPFSPAEHERISDMTCRDDTLIIVGRSYLYAAVPESSADTSTGRGRPLVWQRIQLPMAEDGKPKTTLFRLVWKLHGGELFGTAGRIAVDGIAVILVFLCITGVIILIKPGTAAPGDPQTVIVRNTAFRFSSLWHSRIGRGTIILTLLVIISGWCLRPPLMIPLLKSKTALPGSDNPWDDRLRMLRYDASHGDWLLSTSDGFYSINSFDGRPAYCSLPKKIDNAPAVSVMGLNAWQPLSDGKWLCCSFSGITRWDRDAPAANPTRRTRAFGDNAISGYTADIGEQPFAVGYASGTDAVAQPDELRTLPMSLWNLALEVHSGRLFFGPAATLSYVFVIGLLAFWCLWSGWKMSGYGRKRKNRYINK